jgi:hypothetical protein
MTSKLQNFWTSELQKLRTSELQDFRTSGLQNFKTSKLSFLDFPPAPRRWGKLRDRHVVGHTRFH